AMIGTVGGGCLEAEVLEAALDSMRDERSRMLDFRVIGPDGLVRCKRASQGHKVPRDLFGTLPHGKHKHLDVMLSEICPRGTFDRPGLYAAIPTLHAEADGEQYGLSAVTGRVTVRDPGQVGGTHTVGDDATLIRITRGRKRCYKNPPRAVPQRMLR
ncbi:MAG: XdhC family protein, partial [Myxococcota bacterium]